MKILNILLLCILAGIVTVAVIVGLGYAAFLTLVFLGASREASIVIVALSCPALLLFGIIGASVLDSFFGRAEE